MRRPARLKVVARNFLPDVARQVVSSKDIATPPSWASVRSSSAAPPSTSMTATSRSRRPPGTLQVIDPWRRAPGQLAGLPVADRG
jgi:hypothetical protein